MERGYTSDPVKIWSNKGIVEDTSSDFDYLLNMPLLSLSKEKKEELLKQRDDKVTRVV